MSRNRRRKLIRLHVRDGSNATGRLPLGGTQSPLWPNERTRSRGRALAGRSGALHLPQQPFERAQVTGGRSVLRIEGSSTPTSRQEPPMSQKPISPLRQRMLEDMNMRRFVPETQREYIRAVKKLASFLERSPDTATPEELRAFQLHLTEIGLQPQSINATVTALRFFFKVTLDRPETTRRLVFVYEPRKLPRVLSSEEVLCLLEAAPGPKHKAALSVAYGAGLRAMEVVALKVSDIDSKRMMLRVEQGKGRKDRFAMLSPQLLELLRDWWRIARPTVWMFPGRDRISPMSTRQLNRICHIAAELAALKRWFVYTKRPFAGPKAVLAYLSRYTHRVAISNRRLIALDDRRVSASG